MCVLLENIGHVLRFCGIRVIHNVPDMAPDSKSHSRGPTTFHHHGKTLTHSYSASTIGGRILQENADNRKDEDRPPNAPPKDPFKRREDD